MPLPDSVGYAVITQNLETILETHRITITQDAVGVYAYPSITGIATGDLVEWNNTLSESITIKRGTGSCFMDFNEFVIPANSTVVRKYPELGELRRPPSCMAFRSEEHSTVSGTILVDPESRVKFVLNPLTDPQLDVDTEGGEGRFLSALRTIQTLGVPRADSIVAWVKKGSSGKGGAALGRAAFLYDGEDTYPVAFAHEVAHTLGTLGHSADGAITNEVGWAVLNRADMPTRTQSTQKHELMRRAISDMPYTWIGPDFWTQMFTQYAPPVTPPVLIEFLPIGGLIPIEPGAAPSLYPTMVVMNHAVMSEPGNGDGAVVLVDSSGVEIQRAQFDVNTNEPTHVSVQLPAHPHASEVQLRISNDIVDRIVRTAHSPVITITAPQPGSSFTDTMNVTWEQNDLDGGELYASVLFSHDGGTKWLPLLVQDDTRTDITLDVDDLPASLGQGLLRLIVSDGLNTNSVDVTLGTVGQNHPPRVSIISPANASAFKHGVNIVMSGSASDLEDGWQDPLTGESTSPEIHWTSSIDGYLGSGTTLNARATQQMNTSVYAPLSVGVHTITATVGDSNGSIGSAVVVVSVVP